MELKRASENELQIDRLTGNDVRIYEPRSIIRGLPNIEIMSVLLSTKCTRVDFRFLVKSSDSRVLDLTISPEIRITINDYGLTSSIKTDYTLIHYDNAPISPKRFIPSSQEDILYFTL